MIIMKKNRLVSLIVSLMVGSSMFSLASCAVDSTSYISDDNNVLIELETDQHVKTDSANPQKVGKGNNAEFHLVFDDNYGFSASTFGNYDNETQTLYIPSEKGGGTYTCSSKLLSGYVLNVINNNVLGSVSISPNKKYYDAGEKVTITTTPKINDFLCYTLERPYRDKAYGEQSIPISYDPSYSFIVKEDLNIYVNYFSNDGWTIDYNLNGGLTKEKNASIHSDYHFFEKATYIGANAINLSDYAFRDGYVLDSLNTKQNGSGKRIAIGGRIDRNLFTDKRIALYAQWVRETNLSLFKVSEINSSEVAIEKYLGSAEEKVVIPRTINGKKVTKILSNSFIDHPEIKSIYLSDTVCIVESTAFSGMSGLEDFHLFTSVKEISQSSIESDSLSKIYINRNTFPDDLEISWENMAKKKDSLRQLDETKKRVIVIGHSTVRQNHDLLPLNEKFGDNYSFYIYAASAGLDLYLILESIKDILRPQDYIITPIWPLLERKSANLHNFAFLQYDFDCLLNIDYQQVKSFFLDSFSLYTKMCITDPSVPAWMFESQNILNMNSTGGNYGGTETDDPNNGSQLKYNHYFNNSTVDKYQYLHQLFNDLPIDTSHILLTWNTYNQNAVTNNSIFTNYENMMREEFSYCSFFDTQMDNVYPGNYFLVNDFTHVSRKGADERVKRWCEQLSFE